MKNNKKTILISGSLAYDRIMDFPGRFKDHILPEKIHILNVSFAIGKLNESLGGTAGNIAYSLSLLGEKPKILGVVGGDFLKYEQWLKKQKIDISLIKKVASDLTASAYIMTDRDDNQITGFYGGPQLKNYCKLATKNIKKSNASKYLAIISPEAKSRMVEYTKIYSQLNLPYIFDPGQQITSFNAKELKFAIKFAKVLIGNDYEIQLIIDRLKITQKALEKLVDVLIITKGSKGSEFYSEGKKIKIKSARIKKILDPTGAGDAFRAGLIKGLIDDSPLQEIGQLASTVAVHAVENYGTQNHLFTWKEVIKRYNSNYKEKL